MNQEKIIQAIAAYLEKETYFSETLIKDQKTRQFMRINVMQSHSDFCQEIAAELAAAIAPHLEVGAGWEDAPSWAEWRTVDKNRQVTFWEKQPHAHLLSKYWCDDAGGNRKYCEVDGWQYKIQQRPK